jgi:hypothetical protein
MPGIADGELLIQKKYINGIKEEKKDDYEDFPIKCHLSYWNKTPPVATSPARYGFFQRPPATRLIQRMKILCPEKFKFG